MFDPKVVKEFAQKQGPVLRELRTIEEELTTRFSYFEEPVRALILSVASGEPLLLIGPPGTAKSRLIRAFCATIGIYDEVDQSRPYSDYFEYLLTPFTEPAELFGFYDIALLMRDGQLKRLETDMMHKARVVYLDEVFNASSAILNSILAFLNERYFHDRGQRTESAWQALFAATNDVPQTPELQAVFDRFVLRCWVRNVEADPGQVRKLLRVGWQETYGLPSSNHHRPAKPTVRIKESRRKLLADLEVFQETIRKETAGGQLSLQETSGDYAKLAQLVKAARQHNLSQVSNRRLIKMAHIMLVHRIYEAACGLDGGNSEGIRQEELDLFPRYFLDHTDKEIQSKFRGEIGW